VWWPEEEAWFHGTVAKFDASSGRHGIEYEDGDEKEIALGGRGLSLDKIGFLRAPRGRGVGAKKTPAKKVKKESGTPARKSGRTPKRRAESPPPPPGGLQGLARDSRGGEGETAEGGARVDAEEEEVLAQVNS
jgi:hypothetical protein